MIYLLSSMLLLEGERQILSEVRPILEAIKKDKINQAKIRLAKLTLRLLEQYKKRKINAELISTYFGYLWSQSIFIDKMPEPFNSLVLEAADFSYWAHKRDEWGKAEFKRLKQYLRECAEDFLESSAQLIGRSKTA